MSEWKEYKLGEIYDFASGLSKSRDQFGFGYSFLSFKDVFHNYFTPKEITQLANSTEKERERCSIKRGDVFLTRTSETQEELGMSSVALKDYPDATFNGFTKRLRPKNNIEILPEYAGFYFRSPRFRATMTSMASITTRASLNNGMLSELTVVIPPLPEQRAIASVLSSLDDKIDLLHRQNKTLEAMAETLFRQWFLDGAQVGWEEVKIKDLNVIVTDYVANGSFAALAENVDYKSEPDYAVLIRLTDFNNNFNGDFVFVDEHAYNFLDKSKLFGGEIIISNVGAYSGTVFKCPILNRPMTLGPNSIVIKSEFNNYFYLFFKSRPGQYLLDGIISGSAQPKFNKTAFRNISLNYPSIEYIREFENVVKPYFDKFDLNQSQICTLEKLRNTLLPKLMSGEIRVKLEQQEADI